MPTIEELQAIVGPCQWLAFVFLLGTVVALVQGVIVLGTTHKRQIELTDRYMERYYNLLEVASKTVERLK